MGFNVNAICTQVYVNRGFLISLGTYRESSCHSSTASEWLNNPKDLVESFTTCE